jgi:transposase
VALPQPAAPAPPAVPPPATGAAAPDLTPNRWTLERIRETFDWLKDYTLSGVWRHLRRQGVRLRGARVQQFSPDPDYQDKLIDLEMTLWEAGRYPGEVEAIFLDQMSFQRWPEPGPDWQGQAPVADRRCSPQGLWRLMGGLNALTGQVTYLDNYIVGRRQVIQMYGLLDEAYPKAERIYAIQDNWSIHKHADVVEGLKRYPRIEPVFLPTYAPWLNPIEKLWGWLRPDVIKMHRLAESWQAVRDRVRAFLRQFAEGSEELLHRVGLSGDGQLARMIHGP